MLLELGLATMVITPGENVRRQAIDRFNLQPDRVVAVPEAAAHWFRPVETAPAPPYFLFVGTLEPRKNLRHAAGSLARSARASCGRSGARRAAAAPTLPRLRPSPDCASLGEVADSDLAGALLGRAGVCLPVALRRLRTAGAGSDAVRRAVIASRAVEEAAGDAAIYADTPRELAGAMSGRQRPELAAARASVPWRARGILLGAHRPLTRQVYEEARARFGA